MGRTTENSHDHPRFARRGCSGFNTIFRIALKRSLERSAGQCVTEQGDASDTARHLVAAQPHTTTPSPGWGRATPAFITKISRKGDAYGATRLPFTSRESLRPMRQADSRAGLKTVRAASPISGIGLRKPRDELAGILEGGEMATALQRYRIVKRSFPTPAANDASPSCRMRF